MSQNEPPIDSESPKELRAPKVNVPERPSFEAEGKSAINRLRLLDFDDLYLLTHLLDGQGVAQTARQLGLTQPAITQRVRKIERVFEETILTKVGRHVKLTKVGRAICLRARDALAMMREVTSEPGLDALIVGASPSVGQSWLWPALRDLRVKVPGQLIHCVIGAGEELLGMLDSGAIHACLTSAAAPSGPFGSEDVGETEYMLVAAPAVAVAVKSIEDLKQVLLLELDRSFPLLSRVERLSRAGVRFGDVWYLGALSNVSHAALAGFGVAVLPQSMAAGALAAGKLVQVLPEIDVVPERFRLIFRREPRHQEVLAELATLLKKKSV